MTRSKYPIHPDFRLWAHLHPPLYAALMPPMQFFLRLLYPMRHRSKLAHAQWLTIPTDGGTMRVWHFAPKNLPAHAPCLICFHGGGFVFPAAPNHFHLAKEYALGASCHVLLPDYPLAPKYRFPAAPIACYAVYRYALSHASALSIDPARIAVAGDSAGGELTLDVCLMAKNDGETIPAAQMLFYPAVGYDTDTPSMAQFTDTPMCSSRDVEKYDAFYLGSPACIPAGMEQYASPLNKASLAALPPAYIETAEFDCLRDGATLLAKRLQEAGVPALLHHTKGTIHGFDVVKNSGIVRECLKKRICFLQDAFSK